MYLFEVIIRTKNKNGNGVVFRIYENEVIQTLYQRDYKKTEITDFFDTLVEHNLEDLKEYFSTILDGIMLMYGIYFLPFKDFKHDFFTIQKVADTINHNVTSFMDSSFDTHYGITSSFWIAA